MRIGILGGTFNPIHLGHLAIAQEVLDKLKLDKVIFIPSFLPPHKEDPDIAPAKDRYKMACLATESNPNFVVSRIELDRGGKSYSVETVKEFRRLYKGSQLYYILGTDAYLDISTWKDVDELLQLCHFIVVKRPGFDIGKPERKYKERITLVDVPALAISSRDIRGRIREGKEVRYLIPEEVEGYIHKKGLYLKR